MGKLNVIPMPNKIIYLGSEAEIKGREIKISIDNQLEEEEYILSVDSSEISISASGEKGVFYAKQTLKQLGEGCPSVKIIDKPAFSYRAFHLDTVRHYFGVDEIKKLVDAAASVKMNAFHWHITDDQGFRFFSKRRPEATEKSAFRPYSNFGRLKEDGAHGGFYTPEQLKEIVDYCAERFITVIPEFDVPGHCSALIHAFPEIGCGGKEVAIKTKQGVYKDILCAGSDKTFEVIFDILSDMLEIFPSEYIHIGGDEAPKKHWQECPKCQKRMKSEGLKNEEELQGWFTKRIVDFLKANGRKAIVWNESLKSGMIENDVTVQMWLDKKKLSFDFASRGGRVINSDFFAYYCDYPYALTPLNKTYNFNPVPKTVKNPENIIGIEVPLWTEFINNFDRLCYLAFPRFTAAAETGWTNRESKNSSDFIRRFDIYSSFLLSLGISPAPKKDWNPNAFSRAAGLASFFSQFLIK